MNNSFKIVIVTGAIFSGLILLCLSGCKKDDDNIATDIDGNLYHIVTIGAQEWMTENLKVTRYRNGDPIPNVTGDTAWDNLSNGAWCDFDNESLNAGAFGHLYNWHAVDDPRGLCPDDFHVPSDEEWTELAAYLGGEEVAGGKLKSTDTTYWYFPNTGATNTIGFSGLPGGCRRHDGPFHYGGFYGFWWSATVDTLEYSWYRSLVFDNPGIFRNHYRWENGLSVRCVRDYKAY